MRMQKHLVKSALFVYLFSSFTALFAPSQSHAADYVLSTYEAGPRNPLMQLSPEKMSCEVVFGIKTAGIAVKVQRVASFSVDKQGRRDDMARGYMHQERTFSEYDKITEETLKRILSDWRNHHDFSETQVQALYKLHESLNRSRTKFITVESMDGSLFSGMRIYDSSPVMKHLGRSWQVPSEPIDTKELTERVFANVDLGAMFARVGIKREKHTWSMGLLDISGNQEKALQTLLAQAADLLDLHYNDREFFNFKKTGDILREDVDIVFYSNARLKQYYQRVLKVPPLKDENGKEIVLTPRNSGGAPNEFFIFHLKGSDFIKRFFKLEYHEPMFSSNKALRRHVELYNYLQSRIQFFYDRLNPADYRPRDTMDFMQRLRDIAMPFLISQYRGLKVPEEQYWHMLAEAFMLRKHMPRKLFEDIAKPEFRNQLTSFLGLGSTQIPGWNFFIEGNSVDSQSMVAMPILATIELFMQDPMLFLINRSALKQ